MYNISWLGEGRIRDFGRIPPDLVA